MTKTKKIGLVIEVLIFILFFVFAPQVLAEKSDGFITIVNPVRISSYTNNSGKSLEREYSVINKKNLPATWLLTYDALEDQGILSVVKSMDKEQEFGVFLEVSQKFSDAAGIEYHSTGFWHHATSVFLSGYTQEERILLIDKVFERFKEVFGYYPKSVGSWWTDSYSLSYMQQKYGIIANLICSDQYSTDGYQIWGQPWGIPYYPSKFHAGVPASDNSVKLDIINIQWAPRDPLNGYQNSLYSTQDYGLAPSPQTVSYFEKLVKLYIAEKESNLFGQITVGLEADLGNSAYKGEFSKQMDIVKQYKDKGVNVVTMSYFANWYKNRYPELSPEYSIEVDDLLGTNNKSFWYISPQYRLFYVKNFQGIVIKDLRIYNKSLTEPYYVSPNYSFNLSINIPSVIDGIDNPDDVWILPPEVQIETLKDKFFIKGKNIKIPDRLKKIDDLINIKNSGDLLEISFPRVTRIQEQGETIKGLSSEAIHFLKQKRVVFDLLIGKGWNYLKRVSYFIPQGEIYALLYLKSLPRDKVMVYSHECLQCSWHTEFKHPAYANLKSYIRKYSEHPIVSNSSVFDAKEREQAKKELEKTGARYIYLVKFENYFEKLPFSPGDLGVERVFSNANAEVWRVKE